MTFLTKDGILDEWWGVQIINLLNTLDAMHSNNVYHGDLEKSTSYVVRDDSLCIVLPSINGSVWDVDHKALRANDIIGLGKFLKENARTRFNVREWTKFIKLFSQRSSHERNNIKHLRTHPVLRDSEARFNYLREWLDACYFGWNRTTAEKKEFSAWFERNFPRQFLPWKAAIPQNTVYSAIYARRNKKQKEYDDGLGHFQEYLTNVVKHASEDATRERTSVHERHLSAMYPGLLGDLHFACATSRKSTYESFAREDMF